jgi:hypothetical protein
MESVERVRGAELSGGTISGMLVRQAEENKPLEVEAAKGATIKQAIAASANYRYGVKLTPENARQIALSEQAQKDLGHKKADDAIQVQQESARQDATSWSSRYQALAAQAESKGDVYGARRAEADARGAQLAATMVGKTPGQQAAMRYDAYLKESAIEISDQRKDISGSNILTASAAEYAALEAGDHTAYVSARKSREDEEEKAKEYNSPNKAELRKTYQAYTSSRDAAELREQGRMVASAQSDGYQARLRAAHEYYTAAQVALDQSESKELESVRDQADAVKQAVKGKYDALRQAAQDAEVQRRTTTYSSDIAGINAAALRGSGYDYQATQVERQAQQQGELAQLPKGSLEYALKSMEFAAQNQAADKVHDRQILSQTATITASTAAMQQQMLGNGRSAKAITDAAAITAELVNVNPELFDATRANELQKIALEKQELTGVRGGGISHFSGDAESVYGIIGSPKFAVQNARDRAAAAKTLDAEAAKIRGMQKPQQASLPSWLGQTLAHGAAWLGVHAGGMGGDKVPQGYYTNTEKSLATIAEKVDKMAGLFGP